MKSESSKTRIERDALGEQGIPVDSLTGIHTRRALDNFPLSGRPVHREVLHAFGWVKLASTRVNRELGFWDQREPLADALERACEELAIGMADQRITVDALQGGAGTSTNLAVNEWLANRALQIMGEQPGKYDILHPLEDVNLHQSTNDTWPTAVHIAAIRGLDQLEEAIVALQEAFQEKERSFAHVVKVGRTQLQDAVLTTLGREMSAYAEAFNRDRWRLYKTKERLRVVNLGGTAIGTGLGAPRQYIFKVVDQLRELTGLPLARAENLVEATQNADVYVEVHGLLTACASNLVKVASDLRLMSSGPEAGLGEIRLPAVQAGSSIMPGKVNPVIPEAVQQAGMKVIANHGGVAQAASAGALELNPFGPLMADLLLESIDLLTHASTILRTRCVDGLEADEAKCLAHVEASTAVATALLSALGYDVVSEIVRISRERGITIREAALSEKYLTSEQFDVLITPEAVMRLGH